MDITEKEIFKMVYDWGRVGLVVDASAPAYKDTMRKYRKQVIAHFRIVVWVMILLNFLFFFAVSIPKAFAGEKYDPVTSLNAFYGALLGRASYYTTQGCLGCRDDLLMANGEVLDDNRRTVAYNKAPLGTLLLITNTKNGASTVAEVTDTGGFEKYGKIIDLSLATKNALGCSGDCPVMIYELKNQKENQENEVCIDWPQD